MASSSLVVDTSVFIEYLRAPNKTKTKLFSISDKTSLCISTITLYELLMGAVNSEKQNDIELLTSDLTILSFNQKTAMIAAEVYHDLRKRNKMIEFRDLFIAATAIAHDLPVLRLTKNILKESKE